MEDSGEIIRNRTIQKIEVTNLFGYYTYKIEQKLESYNQERDGNNPLLIIYGDNGSGKTTILRMIFYLLSPINNSGHKTQLSEIKFQNFSITLNDGTVIKAFRPDSVFAGGFTLAIQSRNCEQFTVPLELNGEGTIRVSENDKIDALYTEFLRQIKRLNITINFLSDDRKILSFSEVLKEKLLNKRKRFYYNDIAHIELGNDPDEGPDDSVTHAVKNLENWITSKVLKGAKEGDENANSIYSTLIKQIAAPKKNTVTAKQVKNLLITINEIKNDALKYYQSGLMSQIEIDDFEAALSVADPQKTVLIYSVLEPYINGIQGRLNSLRTVQNILSKFLEDVNDYFSNKTITFDINEGFRLFHNLKREPISFQALSSGEKQLLTLFSNVITTSEDSTIFIIDEPEISLNVKWQRKLIKTLLRFSIDKNVQFIFASHSIELLGNHRNSVHKLIDLN